MEKRTQKSKTTSKVLQEKDFAQVQVLLNHKVIDRQQIIYAVAKQICCRNKQGLLSIIRDQGWLSQQSVEIFCDKITETKICSEKFTMSLTDNLFAEQQVNRGVISRKQVDEYIDLLHKLNDIGIQCSFYDLFTIVNHLEKNITTKLIKAKTTRSISSVKTTRNFIDNNYENTLNKEMSMLFIAFQEKILTAKEIAQVLLRQHYDKTELLSEILFKRHFLNSEKLKYLEQKARKENIRKFDTCVDENDWRLASYISNYKILPREEIQTLLHVIAKLGMLGIRYSLNTLIVDSGLMSETSLEKLIARHNKSNKEITVVVRNPKTIHSHMKKRKSYAPLFALLMLCLPLFLVFEVWIILQPTAQKIISAKISQKSVKHALKTKSEPTKTVEVQNVDQKKLPPKTTDDLYLQKGLVEWGKFRITKEQQSILQKNIEVGEQFTKVDVDLHNISASYSNKKNSLVVCGKMNVSNVRFPEDLPLKMYAQLYNSSKTNVYAQTSFFVQENNNFIAEFKIEKVLIPNVYFVQVMLKPELQDDFTKYLLNTNTQIWNWFIYLGNKQQQNKWHSLYRETFTNTFESIEKYTEITPRQKQLYMEEIQKRKQEVALWDNRTTPYDHITKKLSNLLLQVEELSISTNGNLVEKSILLQIKLQKLKEQYDSIVTSASLFDRNFGNKAIRGDYP